MAPRIPAPSEPVAAWFGTAPDDVRDRLEELRGLVHDVAFAVGAWPLLEEVKWGQPSYRSSHGDESTPIRLGWTDRGDAALLTHCRSRVIPEFRPLLEDRFRLDGDRAVLFGPTDDPGDPDVVELVRYALTYRRRVV